MPANTKLTYKEEKNVATLHGSQFQVNRILRLAITLLTAQVATAEGQKNAIIADIDALPADTDFFTKSRFSARLNGPNATLQRLKAERREYHELLLGDLTTPGNKWYAVKMPNMPLWEARQSDVNPNDIEPNAIINGPYNTREEAQTRADFINADKKNRRELSRV